MATSTMIIPFMFITSLFFVSFVPPKHHPNVEGYTNTKKNK
ncbi:MAG: hypothetical protein UX71_C0001G0140 [Parcubacteria group bacterium GW2011_GWA1_47_10]|nr:MAG: hypothetical protein UX71_C0001G0140 [Parcubacteria group bacterium GW2011_GWA1_47_10]